MVRYDLHLTVTWRFRWWVGPLGYVLLAWHRLGGTVNADAVAKFIARHGVIYNVGRGSMR